MKYYTHGAFGLLAGLILINILQPSNQILFIIVTTIASLMPDLDETQARISRGARPISAAINFIFGHRNFIHSIWPACILYLIIMPFSITYAIAALAGYLSHLLTDGMTPVGIKPLWPLQKRLKGPIRTGSTTEFMVLAIIAILDIWLIIRI